MPLLRIFALQKTNQGCGHPAATEEREARTMPFYHFDLINTRTVTDEGVAELPDDIEAMDSADAVARRVLTEHPELRNRHYAILVSNEDGDEICRVPLDILH
jgi:hypothetical protein